MQLGDDLELGNNELKLSLALLCEHLNHHFVQLLSIHGLEDLVLHVPSRLPQTRRNVHLTHTVPIQSDAFNLEVFAEVN